MSNVSVDEKGALWWIASILWGYVTFLTLMSLSSWIDLFNFWLFLGALALGAVLGLPAWRKWRSGGFIKEPPEPVSIRFVDTEKDRGEYSFRIVGATKTKIGPAIKEPKVSYGSYLAWWVFVRAPVLVGDWLLSAFYGAFDRVSPDTLPGVGRLPGFGGDKEKSILEQARELDLIDQSDDIDNPHVGKF